MAPIKMKFTISLPMTDIAATKRFGAALGFELSSCFDPDNTLHLKYDDSFGIFYGTHSVFGQFLPSGREIASAKTVHEAIVTLSVNSKEEVDELIKKGIEAGGKLGPNMIPELIATVGLYSRSMEDPDGHLYEVVYYDEEAGAAAMAHGTACGEKKDEN